MTPAEEVAAAHSLLLAKLHELAGEVTDTGAEEFPGLDEIEQALTAWGVIPGATVGEIREMVVTLERLAGLTGLPAVQARLALVPANQVVVALDNLIAKVRAKKADAA